MKFYTIHSKANNCNLGIFIDSTVDGALLQLAEDWNLSTVSDYTRMFGPLSDLVFEIQWVA